MSDPADSEKTESPLSLYVVFHPESAEARALADHLHDWFRLKTDDGERSESGLPIWYRCALKPASEAGQRDGPPPQTITPDIDWDGARHNIVVVLGDRHLVGDRLWRYALEKLHRAVEEESKRALLLPVEMERAIHQLAFLTANRNPVRIGTPVRPRLRKDADDPDWDRAVAERARLLRRAVTESVARKMLADPEESDADGAPKRLTVFLSHAKRDGVKIAEKLRDSLASYGQLQVWFDASDLPAGYGWAGRMRAAAGELTALVSVVTDAYPSRPWCRAEVDRARRPCRVPVAGRPARSSHAGGAGRPDERASVWRVQPTIAVQSAGANWSRSMAQLVHVPAIGWDENDHVIARRIADVADRLVLEILVAAFQQSLATQMARQIAKGSELPEGEHAVLLTFVPEPRSLVFVLSELLREDRVEEAEAGSVSRATVDSDAPSGEVESRPDQIAANGRANTQCHEPWLSRAEVNKVWVAYPGHALRTLEQRELQDSADGIACLVWGGANRHGRPRIELISQESFDRRDRPEQPRFAVCLSGGGDDQGLARDGVGMPHVDDLFVQLARRLLESGRTLVYGGSLGDLQNNLTVALMDAAYGWVRDTGPTPLEDRPPPTAAMLDRPPFVNHSPWPHTRHIGLQHEADYVGVCRFERVLPPGVSQEELDRLEADGKSPRALGRAAEALEEMRRKTSAPGDQPIRIVVGGKLSGFTGFISGIADEVLHALHAGQLPIILGGFGGCASVLGEFLASSSAPWPTALMLDRCLRDEPLATLCRESTYAQLARERFAELERRTTEFRDRLRDGGDPFDQSFEADSVDRRARQANVELFQQSEFRRLLIGLLRQKSPTLALGDVLQVVERVAEARPAQPSS